MRLNLELKSQQVSVPIAQPRDSQDSVFISAVQMKHQRQPKVEKRPLSLGLLVVGKVKCDAIKCQSRVENRQEEAKATK